MFETITVGGSPTRYLKGQEKKIEQKIFDDPSGAKEAAPEAVAEPVEVVDFHDPVSFLDKLPKDFYKLLVFGY